MTSHVPDCGFLIIERLCNYAMSVTMPMIDKERTVGRKNSVAGLDELPREEKKHH